MKAIVYTTYGPPEVLHSAEVQKPVPKDDEVLIKVGATAATTGDANVRGFTFVPPGFGVLPRLMFGLRKPKNPVIGHVLAGTIEKTGKNVTAFKAGDRVFGINSAIRSTYAEYVCWPAKSALAPLPAEHSFTEAAALPFGATTALHFLRNLAKLESGQRILIIGASGGVGIYAVQLAKQRGAIVTGVCSTRNTGLVRSLGADEVIDYTIENVMDRGERFDVILDTVVGKTSFSAYRSLLTPRGCYLPVAGGLREMRQAIGSSLFSGNGQRISAGMPAESSADLLFIKELVESGALKPVISHTFSLEQAAQAHRQLEQGPKAGCIVISVT